MSYDDLRKGRYSEGQRIYFVTTVLAERERRYFADYFCASNVVAEMRSLHDDEVVGSLAWVVMPDHVHWLFQLGEDAVLPQRSNASRRVPRAGSINTSGGRARCGKNRSTTTRCVKMRICGALRVILPPTHCALGWLNI